MATFYIQLENRLLQISGELTAENISKALGYVPVSPNVTNELSQRVDNITFDSLKDNPFLQDGSGELNIVDEAGNIIAKVSSEGIRTIEVLAGEHRLSEKANKSDLPTKLSDLDNDTNYITLADIPPVNIPSLDEYVTEEELNSKGYITQHQDISHLATKAEVSDIDFYNIKNNPVINSETGKLLFVDESGNIGLQLEDAGLFVANVFAGHHVLSNKADKSEIPTATSQLENDSNFVSSDGLKTINGESIYGGGDITIEAEEIYEVDVPYYESNDIIGITTEMWNKLLVTPTISAKVSNTPFKITLNKTDLGMGNLLFYIGSSINLGTGAPLVVTVVFSGEGENFVGIPPNSCASTYSSLPISTSQLENDSNFVTSDGLKTINGESIVGSGNIEISGGSSSGGSGAYSEVNHGTSDTTFTLTPNTFHVWDEVASLTLDFGSETSGVANEYLFQFTSGSTATTLSLPSDLKWANDTPPAIVENMIYQVSILKGLASVLEFSNTVVTLIDFTIGGASYQAEEGMHWAQWCMSQYNTDGFYVEENCIWKESRYYIRYNYAAVYSDELITAGLDYELKDDMD